jgi:uncharacterized SAM-binding protein YcdF (DUF218 family)
MFEIIKAIIIPSNLILVLSAAGVLCFLIKIKRKIVGGLLGAALILYIVFGTGIVSFWLLNTLETRYPQLKDYDGIKGVREIVVLTGYAETDPILPPSSEVNFASAFRVLETRRIFNFLPGANVLITGGGDAPTIMGNLLVSLGVPRSRIIPENQSSNTLESAIQVQKLLKGGNFILVTSAGHMPRAMGAFKKLGMDPIPAPTNFMSVKKIRLIHFLPSPLNLEYSDLAVHEYLGIAWYRLTNGL